MSSDQVFYGVIFECSCGLSIQGGLTGPGSVWKARDYLVHAHGQPTHRLSHVVKEMRRPLLPYLSPTILNASIDSFNASSKGKLGSKAKQNERPSGAPHRESVCWNCNAPVLGTVHQVCEECGWLICACGACRDNPPCDSGQNRRKRH